MDKKQTMFLSVVGILTLLFAIVGATFAYFTVTVKGNEEASSIIIRTSRMGQVVFTDGAEVALTDAYPGAFITKTFSVSYAGEDGEEISDTEIIYDVYLDQIQNDFWNDDEDLRIDEFVHYIYDVENNALAGVNAPTGDLAKTPVPNPATSGTVPIFSGILRKDIVHTYEYKIGLEEIGSDQNEAQGKSFAGKLRVEVRGSGGRTTGEDGSSPVEWSSSEE